MALTCSVNIDVKNNQQQAPIQSLNYATVMIMLKKPYKEEVFIKYCYCELQSSYRYILCTHNDIC